MLRVVGFGPGSVAERTHSAEDAIRGSDIVVGYKPYLQRISDLLDGKETFGSGMMKERERAQVALDYAAQGRTVSLVSSGDPGVYGMAGLVLEMVNKLENKISVEIIPGISAANTAASRLGAPLMLDYAVISLSNLLVPWEQIEKRLRSALAGDFVIVLYNPRSRKRVEPFNKMCAILKEYLNPQTPVGVVTAIGLEDEKAVIADVQSLAQQDVEMRSTIIVGNSTSTVTDGWFYTPRGYFSDNNKA